MKQILLLFGILASLSTAQNTDVLFWTTRASIPAPGRCQIQTHGNVRDTIYICGGRTAASIARSLVEAYVPLTNTWVITLPPMPGSRSHGCGAVIDSILYAAGGFDSLGVQSTTFYAFNANAKTWTTLAPLPLTNILCAGAAYGGMFYVFGGTRVDTLFQYNPAMNNWVTRVPTPRPPGRRAAAAAGTANYLYVMGGLNTSNVALQDCWRYARMGGGTWTQMADMPGPRVLHAAYTGLGDSVIYVAGGNPTSMVAVNDNIVYKYTIATNTWTTETPMPTTRGFLTLDRAQDKIYALGGQNTSGMLTTNEEGGPVVGSVSDYKNGSPLASLTLMPNPARQYCSLIYHLSAKSQVMLAIYDASGELVRTVVNKTETQGMHTVHCDCAGLSAGVYFLKLKTDKEFAIQKLLIVK